MKATLLRSYKKRDTGSIVFVYTVTGSKEQLEAFKEIQGAYYTEDPINGPLWFTTKCVGQQCPLIITSKGNLCADTSAFDQAASLAAQYGGNLGQELARAAAQQLMGNRNPIAAAPVAADPVFDDASEVDEF